MKTYLFMIFLAIPCFLYSGDEEKISTPPHPRSPRGEQKETYKVTVLDIKKSSSAKRLEFARRVNRNNDLAKQLLEDARKLNPQWSLIAQATSQLQRTLSEHAQQRSQLEQEFNHERQNQIAEQKDERAELAENQKCERCVHCCERQCFSSVFVMCCGDSACKACIKCGQYCAALDRKKKAEKRQAQRTMIQKCACCCRLLILNETGKNNMNNGMKR